VAGWLIVFFITSPLVGLPGNWSAPWPYLTPAETLLRVALGTIQFDASMILALNLRLMFESVDHFMSMMQSVRYAIERRVVVKDGAKERDDSILGYEGDQELFGVGLQYSHRATSRSNFIALLRRSRRLLRACLS